MDGYGSETDSDYTNYWRDWVRGPAAVFFSSLPDHPPPLIITTSKAQIKSRLRARPLVGPVPSYRSYTWEHGTLTLLVLI